MKTVIKLDAKDIEEALRYWAISHITLSDVLAVRLDAHVSKGDRPWESDSTVITAEIEVAQ